MELLAFLLVYILLNFAKKTTMKPKLIFNVFRTYPTLVHISTFWF
jgi:hypothetical protein